MALNKMGDVVEMIKKLVPEDFKNKEDLFDRLNYIYTNIGLRAPEEEWVSWNHLESALIRYFDKPDTDWKKEINKRLMEITSSCE